MDLGWLPPLLIGLKGSFNNTSNNSDFLKILVQNWIVDQQRKFWIDKIRHQSARKRNYTFDQEVNNHYQRSTKRPKTIKIFVPQNNNRFDVWGG